MNDIVATDATDKEWFKSKAVWGSIVMIGALVASNAGYAVTSELQAELIDTISNVVAMGGAVLALIGRLVATKEIRG